MQNTMTGTAMTMTRASGRTTPRWTLTVVVVVLRASVIRFNCCLLVRAPGRFASPSASESDYDLDFFSCSAIKASRVSMMFEIAMS